MTENKLVGRVQLQGPDDQYKSWKEVERYLLPSTPLSNSEESQGLDTLSRVLDENLFIEQHKHQNDDDGSTGRSDSRGSSSDLSVTPESIKASMNGSLAVEEKHWSRSTAATLPDAALTGQNSQNASPSVNQSVPARLRPLLNFVVWRMHHRQSTDQSSKIYILLTNDPVIQKQAGKFGVRAKLLNQLRKIVSVDEHVVDVKNNKKDESTTDLAEGNIGETQTDDIDDEEEEEKILFDPTQRPKSSSGPPPNLIDPDHFGRGPNPRSPPTSTRFRGSSQPGRGYRGSPRGRFAAQSRNSFVPSIQYPNGPAIIRGGQGSMRGRGFHDDTRFHRSAGQRPIDPDSYARPPPSLRRGRTPFRKIWEPN